MLSLTAESLCLLNGKHNSNPLIIPEEQECVHFNTLWCCLFYRLSGEEKEDKGIAAFTNVQSKNLTISALLDRQIPSIAETNHKPLLFITTKTIAYIPRHRLSHHLSSRLPSFQRTSTRGIHSQGTQFHAP